MIILNIEPKATPRPRVARNRAYYPKSYTTWKKAAKSLLPPLEPPTGRIHVCFVFKRPQRLKKGPRQPHDKRPDLDNLVKSVFDLFDFDDGIISQFSAEKVYAGSDETPRIEIHWSTDGQI